MKRTLIAAALVCAVHAGTAAAEVLGGLVVGVADGDTLTVLDAGKVRHQVRLGEIDAPEKGQPFGQRSKQSLSDLCFQRQANVLVQDRDRYGRIVGRVNCDGVDANAEQVRSGMAWVYDRYAADKKLYVIQLSARQNKTGLWADAAPVQPWEWRKAKRN